MKFNINALAVLVFSAYIVSGCSVPNKPSAKVQQYDVVVYGGSCAGVTAAVQAKQMGKSVVLVNPYSFLGGMTSSGLSSADLGNVAAVSGMSKDFFSTMGRVLGKSFSATFEPHVAEKAFNALIADNNIPVMNNERLDLQNGVVMKSNRIVSFKTESGKLFAAKMFIDATYEGDLMAKAGVSYTVGREGNGKYNETLNGVQYGDQQPLSRIADNGRDDHFIEKVDPYVVPGNPSSGLLPWINVVRAKNGDGDNKIQAYNYRLTLTDSAENMIPFTKPAGYKDIDHELLFRNFEAGDHRLPGRRVNLPNRKMDWNSFGAVGTDMAGADFDYPDADYATRQRIEKLHETYIRGHFWALANHPRVPDSIRKEMKKWGYPKDEFVRNGGFPYMIYIRQARRMLSDYVMTEKNCDLKDTVNDPVVLGSYAKDSHAVQYVLTDDGHVEREGVFLKRTATPYGVSYRSIVPKSGECPNLIVPICLSASHVAYGSIRMEPVYMSLGQVSAIAACLAIDGNTTVQDLPYEKIREQVLKAGITIEWPKK